MVTWHWETEVADAQPFPQWQMRSRDQWSMPVRRRFSLVSVVKRVLTVNSERLLLIEYTETGRKKTGMKSCDGIRKPTKGKDLAKLSDRLMTVVKRLCFDNIWLSLWMGWFEGMFRVDRINNIYLRQTLHSFLTKSQVIDRRSLKSLSSLISLKFIE